MIVVPKPKDPRELAARALCRKAGNPEDATYEGKPMWMSYLDDVDTVLQAVGWNPEPTLPVYAMRKVKG
jgi:hypothetical protein